MIITSTRTRLVAVLAVALVALALAGPAVAGCGGDGDLPSAGGSETTAAPATGAAADATETTAGGGTSAAALAGSLNGAGATFPEPLYVEWIGEFQMVNPDVTINYQGIGSGGGIEQFTKLTVDFGASDAPMKDEEVAAAETAGGAEVLHIPTVFGAVVLAYNLDGVEELRLDPAALAGIFLGAITQWNDPALVALNPDAQLPDEAIQVVHRSDSSGTTSIFTGYLAQVSAEWESTVGKGKEVPWPVGIGGQGNDGVAAVVQQQAGSIGYVELSYATESGLTMATLQNQAGNFIVPSLESTSAASVGVEFPEDLRFSVSNSAGEQAYPIVGATWILVYQKMADPAKVEILKAWLTWSLDQGTSLAEELGYAPLSEELRVLAQAKIDSISTF
ncbi:MAG: phosphate ABC transporter substrate-binding protein PstS [Thermoleophilia bacterium]|nr:phosphate ABC transporter substrate-binding protein PstS [Thermoleophilia bacterium]